MFDKYHVPLVLILILIFTIKIKSFIPFSLLPLILTEIIGV